MHFLPTININRLCLPINCSNIIALFLLPLFSTFIVRLYFCLNAEIRVNPEYKSMNMRIHCR